MQKEFSNGKLITKTDWKEIDNYIEKLEISIEEAISLREFDKFETDRKTEFEKEMKEIKKEKNKKNVITSEENKKDIFENVILIAFKNKEFKSKDLWKLVSDKFSNRQTPHLLKALEKDGLLELIPDTSPKTYKIK